ncbi:transposase [Methylocystis sp. 9N]|uniref:Transposase n=1 Tax=Methylocystis borbori TaxID=3118750 RepID=A0ABU7XJS1_9HYPH
MSAQTGEDDRSNTRKQREEALRELLTATVGKSSASIVEELKKDLGVSRATAYRMVKTFRTCGAVTCATRPVGRPKGARGLDPLRERLIQEAIKAHYSKTLRPKFSALVQDVRKRCKDQLLPPPNWRTIRARLRDFEGGPPGSGNRGS